MYKLSCKAQLDAAAQLFQKALTHQTTKILICAGTGCVAGGSLQI